MPAGLLTCRHNKIFFTILCVKYELTGFIVQLMVFRNLTCKSNESTSKIILLCLPSVSVAWLLRNPKFHVSSYCFDTPPAYSISLNSASFVLKSVSLPIISISFSKYSGGDVSFSFINRDFIACLAYVNLHL